MRQNDTSTTPDYGVDGSPIRVPLICIGLWVLTIALLVFSNPVLKGWCRISGVFFVVHHPHRQIHLLRECRQASSQG